MLSYTCTRGSADYGEPLCQVLSNASTLEELVAWQLLAAVQPAALAASLAAVAGVERQRAELQRQWQLRRERAVIDVDRAARQYQACEPENRLVARELARRGEEALKQQRQLDEDEERFVRDAPAELSDTALSCIRALAANLRAVWSAATTTPADRQRIARRLLERVVVPVDKPSERVDVLLHWIGGTVQAHSITRPGTCYCQQSDYPRLVARLRQLCTGRDNSKARAEKLNAEGFCPPKRTKQFTGEMVRRDEDGHQVIWADASEIRRLRELHALPRTWANRKRLAQLQRPKPRPAR